MRGIIASGGTGGHLFPALALARELKKRGGVEILFVGAGRGVERDILSREGFASTTIPIRGLKGKGPGEIVQTLRGLPRALLQASRILKRFRPEVAVGMGGYASWPLLLVAALKGLPTLIHEQNAYPGLANRLLAPFVDIVALSFQEAAPFLRAKRIEVVGLPIRVELLQADRARALERFGFEESRLTVLVFGGSQGAHRINLTLVEALPLLYPYRQEIQFLHAAGGRDVDWVKEAYKVQGFLAEVEPFFQEMNLAYAAADLCICRAGAGTVAELAALGKPALLIPYPYAADDHQRLNALVLVRVGGARMLLDRELSGEGVATFLKEVLEKPSLLAEMGRCAKALGKPEAASRLASLVVELVKSKQ